MVSRLLEAFFRHKLLLLLPPLLIPLLVTPIVMLRAKVYYEAWTSVWVDRPTYLTYTDDWNSYITPAQNQSGRLAEMLRTRTFIVDVAQRTSLAPLLGTQAGENVITRVITGGLGMYPNGSHLLSLRFRSETPDLSLQLLNALVETFKEHVATDRVQQASIAISFHKQRLQAATDTLNKADEDMRRYLVANPRYASIDPDKGAAATTASRLGLPASAIDPQLAELLRRIQQAQTEQADIQKALAQAQVDASAGIEGQELGFQVVDPATLPTHPTIERKKLLIYPGAGLFVGLVLSSTLLVVLMATDRTVRSHGDVASFARVIGVVPHLRPQTHWEEIPAWQEVWREAGPHTIRRAIGFIAGTDLPALPPASDTT